VEPFSYRIRLDGDNGRHRYKGFLADLCYDIFEGSGYYVHEVEVTAKDRFDELREKDVEVLCDPITLRYSDAERTRSGVYSPIIFTSGVSYLQRRSRAPRSSVYIGYVRGTTAWDVAVRACDVEMFKVVPPDQRASLAAMCASAKATKAMAEAGDAAALRKAAIAAQDAARREKGIADAEERTVSESELGELKDRQQRWASAETQAAALKACTWPACGDAITKLRELFGEDDCSLKKLPSEEQRPRSVYRFCPFDTHQELIEWFCGPHERTTRFPSLVYIGDREIILGKLQTWNDSDAKEKHPNCEVENKEGADDLTYEPYVLMTKNGRLDLAEILKRGIYEFFSFRSKATNHFEAYFPGKQMSPALAYLFLLNAVEEDWQYIDPPELSPPPPSEPVASSRGPLADCPPAEIGVMAGSYLRPRHRGCDGREVAGGGSPAPAAGPGGG
jgi:hypothetical protein